MAGQRLSTAQSNNAALSYVCVVFFFLLSLGFNTLALLVPSPSLILPYHNGPLLAGDEPIKVYVTFYGAFTDFEKSTLRSFLWSFKETGAPKGTPTVANWWSLTRGYMDSNGNRIAQRVLLEGETVDSYSLGKVLKRDAISFLVESSLKIFPLDKMAIYLLLTAEDVYVENFCMNTCGHHLYTQASVTTEGQMLPYAWVGNSQSQCPGFCAWPYARSQFGSKASPLKAPNAVGVDGMIITLAKVLAGAATNPFGTAYYQGDAAFAVEAAGACAGAFGAGAYPGYPGKLLVEDGTGASYNMEGFDQRKFLLPWMWNPYTLSCAGQPDEILTSLEENNSSKLYFNKGDSLSETSQ